MRVPACFLFALTIFVAGCPPINQAEADIQDAINQISADSASWQTFLQNLEGKLVTDLRQDLADQVAQLIQNGIAVAGTEVRCDVDFIAKETTNALLRMIAVIDPAVQPPPLVPAICQVVPSTIDMNDPPSVVNFYGYNFDVTGANLAVTFNHDGLSDDATPYLSLVSPYLATLNISQTNGLSVCNEQNRSIVLQTGAQPISTVGFVTATCPSGYWAPGPGPRTLTPPVDYSLGGGLFGASSNFQAGSACTPGYVRLDPPQINKLTNTGDCGISWASSDPTDCTVNVHEGISAFLGVECLVTINETGLPVWQPPPACPCQ